MPGSRRWSRKDNTIKSTHMIPIILLAVVATTAFYIALVRGYVAGLVFLLMALPGTVKDKIKQTILAIGDMLGLIRYDKKLMDKRGWADDDIF